MMSVAPLNALNTSYHPSSITPLRTLRDPTLDHSLDYLRTHSNDLTSSEKNARIYLDNIVNLVSYNGCYIPECFKLLVQGFIPIAKDTDYDLELSDKISHLIHATLQKIVTLVPLGMSLLGNALKEQFPHKRHNSEELFIYLKNLLLVSYYAPSLIEPLITTAVDRLIQIDVDIKLEDVEEEDLQFEVEIEQQAQEQPGNTELTARKLDSMMLIMFEYLDAAFGICATEQRERTFPPMNLTRTHQEQLFNILLQIFDKFVLTTYKSKYTQFLLFYVCRLKPDDNNSFSSKFMAYLYNKIQTKIQNKSNQMASAAYLGSFLSRASYVPATTLREVVAVMLNWQSTYINAHLNATPDAVVHGLFYAMSQSLYYIFCFHHEKLLEGGEVDTLKRGYKRITESKFNPLKFCLPTIVREFVRICAEIKWHDYNDLMKANEKLILATTSSFGGANQLEMFFPFDPYLLKYSSRYIDEYYVKWTATDDEDEEDEEKAAFADDSDSSDDDDSDAGDHKPEEENDRESSDELEQLSHDFMHFTPDVERDITYHFSYD